MSQQSLPLPTLTPSLEYRSLIPQPNFLLNFPVPYQSLNNPFHSSQRASCEAQSNPDEPNLADAIHDFTQTVWENQGSGNGSKVQEPDVFDGSDTRKLQAFLVQYQLNFNSKPQVFWTDASKVNYVISYLKGTTLDWFEPGLMSYDPPDWISNYFEFTSELKCNFRPHDPKGDMVMSPVLWYDSIAFYFCIFSISTLTLTYYDAWYWHDTSHDWVHSMLNFH